MKPRISFPCSVASLLLSTVLLAQLARGDSAPALAEAPPSAPQSVFDSQLGSGKDPFFPNSTRLRPRPIVRVADPTSIRSGVPDFIVLKGLSILNDRKLAIINNRTVEAGEEFTLKVSGHALKVKCVEIKEDSVIIEVNGSTKELQLRPGL